MTLSLDATAAQREAVEQTLAGSNAVADFEYQSQEEGARIFRCVFADKPEDLATANLARIPPMFHVTLVAGADPVALIRRLEAEPGVSDAGLGNCSTPADLEVFFVVNPTPEQIAAAEGVVEQSPGVADTVFVSREDAYREFACLFVDQPDLLEATTPAALPPSIRIDLEPGADASGLIQQFEALAGVDAVAESRYPIAMPLPEFGPDDFGPPPEGHTEIATGDTGGAPWRLSLRVDDGRYSAVADFNAGDVALEGTDDRQGWDIRATGLNGITVGSLQPGVDRVRIEGAGIATYEFDAIAASGLELPLFVTRLPVGQTVTLVALDDAGDELYRIETQTSDPTTAP